MRTGIGFGAHGHERVLDYFRSQKNLYARENAWTPGTAMWQERDQTIRNVIRNRTMHYMDRAINLQNGPTWRMNGVSQWRIRERRSTHRMEGKYLREYITAVNKADDADVRIACVNDALRYARDTGNSRIIQAVQTMVDEKWYIEMMTCAYCANVFVGEQYPSTSDGDYFCPTCVQQDRVHQVQLPLECAGLYQADNYRVAVRDGDESFHTVNATFEYVNERSFVYDNRTGTYYQRQDYAQLRNGQRECAGTEIYGYHEGPNLGHIPSAFDKCEPRCLLGMELEVETPNDGSDDDDEDYPSRSDIAEEICYATQTVIPNYLKCENDGSLDHGFEMITGYTGLDVHEKMLDIMCKLKMWRHLRSHDTSTCGLHVHADRKNMTPLHMIKLQAFINANCNKEMIRCIARRYNGSYAHFYTGRDWAQQMPLEIVSRARNYAGMRGGNIQKALKQGVDTAAAITSIQDSRYSALNWQNEWTVEFRMFRGSTKMSTIMACLEFTYAAWHFSRVTPLGQLTTPKFMEYICSPENRAHTKYLRAYFQAKKYRQFYEQEQVFRPKDKRVTLVQPNLEPSGFHLEADADCVIDPDELREHASRIWPQQAQAREAERLAREQSIRDAAARGTAAATWGGAGQYPTIAAGTGSTTPYWVTTY